MEELTLIENLEKYPYLKEHLDTTLIVSASKFHMYENDIKVSKGKKKISLELLKNLIEKDEYYLYVQKLLKGEIDRLIITKIVNGDLIITYTDGTESTSPASTCFMLNVSDLI